MDLENKVPQTYLENIDLLNSASQLKNEKSNILLLNSNSNILPNNHQKTSNSFLINTNSFYRTKNDNSTNIQSSTQNDPLIFSGQNFKTKYLQDIGTMNKINNLNSKQRFDWKDIINNNILIDENQLDNPLIKNILKSKLNENEIQNIPENYLVDLISTLQGVATKAIENKNNLEMENQRLYKDLSEMENNYNNLAQSNEKMSKSIYRLKMQNNRQQNLIKNYEDKKNNYGYNSFIDIKLNNYKYLGQKFYCQFCTNKIFKSQYYLDKHIKRRHPNTYDDLALNKAENKELKKMKNNYEKKLKEMKKYFDLLINASIRKNHYMRINEKLNGIQNLLIMQKQQDDFYNNIIYNNYSVEDNDNNNYKDYYNDEYNSKEGQNQNEENNINDKNNKLKSKNQNRGDNENENDEANQKIIKNIKNEIKALRNEMNYFFNKSRMELLEINREKHFQMIKNYFEKNQKVSLHQNRKNKKNKTIKTPNHNILYNNIKGKDNEEINQSADEIIKDIKNKDSNNIDFSQSQKKLLKGANTYDQDKKNKIRTYNKEEKKINFKIDINNNREKDIAQQNTYENKNNSNNNKIILGSQKESEWSEEKSEKKKKYGISFSNSENRSSSQMDTPLEIFYKKFRERDGNFSRANKEDYFKEIISNEEKKEQKEIDKIIEEKIEEKLVNINKNNNEELISDIIKLNYQILDQNYIFGDVFCFYSRNISYLIDTQKLINEANNYYYHINKNKNQNIKSFYDRSRELNQNLFETVNYQIQDTLNDSNFSLRNNNNNA